MTSLPFDDFDMLPDPARGRAGEAKWPVPVRVAVLMGVAPVGWLFWGILVFGLQKLVF